MKVNPELLELTNKFISEFLAISAKRDGGQDDLYNFHFTLADAITQSNYPKYKERTTILMGMASFDDSIAKGFFNNNIQGFIEAIEKRLAYTGEQEDYIVNNIKTTEFLMDTWGVEFYTTEAGEKSFKPIPEKTPAQKITFDVANHKSGFKGNVVMIKRLEKVFSDNENYEEKMIVDEVRFYCNKNEVMNIRYRMDYETFKFYEEGTFTHYKHIADINSFFYVLDF